MTIYWPSMANGFPAIIAGLFLAPASSYACSPSPSVFTELPKSVAETGYLVKARVIRGYDAAKRQPEILLVDKIFVGEGMPREMILLRDDAFFEDRANGIGDTCSAEFPVAEDKPRLFAVFRAKSSEAYRGEDRWIVDAFYPIVTDGEGRERLLAEAARNGRLRGQPLDGE